MDNNGRSWSGPHIVHILVESETCILSILLWILEIIFIFLFINRKILIISDSSDSDYSHIYGRLPIPTRGIRKFPAKPMFLRWLFLSYIFFFKMNCSNPFNIFFSIPAIGNNNWYSELLFWREIPSPYDDQ